MKYAQLACIALLLMGLLSGCGDDSETSTMPEEPSMPTADSQSDPAMSGTGADGVENASARDDGNVTDGEMDGEATQDIAEILETDPRFSRVLELVNLIGLLDVMRTPGPFTIFIPTNEAIDSLPGDLMDRVRDEPTFLHQFILAHVAEGDLASEGLVDGESVRMIGGPVLVNFTDDDGVQVGGAPVIEADIPATNGRLHALSGVIPIPEMETSEE